MIVAFLLLYNYCASLIKYFGLNKFFCDDKWAVLIFEVPTIDGKSIYSESGELKFIPPLYFQRYEVVREILKTKSDSGILKVTDFGCSEIGFFQIIKHMRGVHEYLAVDIDTDILKRYSCRVNPLTFDYLKKRNEPLVAQVLCGSVSQPDLRLQNSNAVLAIELIEHLYPDVLEELPYNIFGLIQPEIAIFTTPNSEYNILFPNFSGFRHFDHKFEWNRDQFQSWALNLVLRYPNYKVVFGGVGLPPANCDQDLGYCTQIAVFFRNRIKLDTSAQFCDVYEVIKKVEFPFITEIEQLENFIHYGVVKFISYYSKLDRDLDNDRIEIPLKDIHTFILRECCCTEDQLREVLTSCGRKINILENGSQVLILDAYGEEDLDDSYESSLEEYDQPYTSVLLQTEEDEDWNIPISLTAMDPVQNGIEKATSMGGSPSPREMEQSESTPFTTGSSSEPSYPDCINNPPDQTLFLEEGQSSSSGSREKNNSLHMNQNSCAANTQNNESTEKSGILMRSSLQKCHSLESVSRDRSKNNPCRFSLNIDKYKILNCDIGCSNNDLKKVSSKLSVSDTFVPRQEDSCSQSKAADSGYPNSYGQDMDMDLTPEQVDEIITESESSFEGEAEDESGGEEDELLEIHGEILRLGENVENGDVANNNRDGEGNNMEAVAAGGVLQFEQVIAEEEVAIGNLAAADVPELNENLGFISEDRLIAPGCEREVDEIHPQIQDADFFLPVINVDFPDWLLNILADDLDRNEEDSVGAGDAFVVEPPETLTIDNEESDSSEVEQLSDLELLEEPPLELIVQGDLMGGGEPPPNE